MANEKIEIDIVLNDGSIAKGFAKINEEASKAEGILDGAFKVFTGLQLSNAVDRVASGLKGLFGDAIKEAIQGEESINQLASAMQSAGTYTGAAVEHFKDLADKLQNTTKFSDDAVISAGALARNFTKTNEQAEKLTLAAVQLSAATGRDLNTSIEQLGGTLTGTAGRLSKTVPELNTLTESALKSGAAIKIVADRFDGVAQNQLNTFSGAIALAKNQFNNFLEDLGNQIIRNPTFIAALKGFGEFFNNVIGNFKGNAEKSRSIIDSVVIAGVDGFTLLARAVAFVGNNIDSIKLAVTSLYLVILKANQGILDVDLAASKIGNKFGLASDAYVEKSKGLNDANLEAIKGAENLGAAIADSQLKNAGQFDFLITESERLKNSVLEASKQVGLLNTTQRPDQNRTSNVQFVDQKALEEAKLKLEGYRDAAFDLIDEVYRGIQGLKTIDVSSSFEQLGLSLKLVTAETSADIAAVSNQVKNFRDTTLNTAKQIGEAVKTGLANAIVGGINAFVTAIVNGENAFKNFGKAVLGIIGDLAQQIGGFIIAAGIAKAELFSGNPYTTIAAGVALVAIGAALKAISSKGQSGGFSGAASSGSSLTPPLTPATPVSGDGVSDPQSKVQVIVQGNVFDSDATGLRIAEILKEQGFANAVKT